MARHRHVEAEKKHFRAVARGSNCDHLLQNRKEQRRVAKVTAVKRNL